MKNQIFKWFIAVLSEFIEGACDAFLIVAGGSVATSAVTSASAVQWHQLAISSLVGGIIYAASFMKKNPTPFTTADNPLGASPETKP